MRPNKILMNRYGLGDDSRGGFGSVLSMPNKGSDGMEDVPGRVHASHGVWCELHMQLINLVDVVWEEVESGRKKGVDLFFLTDNSVSYAVYHQGNSINKDIFYLIIRLVHLELRGCFRLHNIWVAGNGQIASGIYSFSRGCLTDRIDSDGSILDFVPLNETAFERLA